MQVLSHAQRASVSSRASAAEEQWSYQGILDHPGDAALIRESWPNLLMKMRSGRTLVEMRWKGKIAIGGNLRPKQREISLLASSARLRSMVREIGAEPCQGRARRGGREGTCRVIDHGANPSILTSVPIRVMVM